MLLTRNSLDEGALIPAPLFLSPWKKNLARGTNGGMMDKNWRSPKKRDFIRDATIAGNEVITRGFQSVMTHERGKPYAKETVAFVFFARAIKRHVTNPADGFTKYQLKTIKILEDLGLRVIRYRHGRR